MADFLASYLRPITYFIQDRKHHIRPRNDVAQAEDVKVMDLQRLKQTKGVRKMRKWANATGFGSIFVCGAIAYHQVLMMIGIVSIVLSALSISGCTSNIRLIPNLYLLQLSTNYGNSSRNIPPSSQLIDITLPSPQASDVQSIRVSFFATCLSRISSPQFNECSGTTSATDLYANVLNKANDPLGLVIISSRFRTHTVFPYLSDTCIAHSIVAAILLTIAVAQLLRFPGWRDEISEDDSESAREVKPFPSRLLLVTTTSCCLFASLLLLCAALWQHSAAIAFSEAVDESLGGLVDIRIGTAAIALSWLACALAILVFICLIVMTMSIAMLDQLIDD